MTSIDNVQNNELSWSPIIFWQYKSVWISSM